MTKKFQRILERIALENNTTAEAVYREMQQAIDAGFDNPDPEVQERWKLLGYNGKRPTPEDLVMNISKMLKGNKGIIQ